MKIKMMIMGGLVASSSMLGAEIPQVLQGMYYQDTSSKESCSEKDDTYGPRIINKKKMYEKNGDNCDVKKILSAKKNKYKIRFECDNLMDGGRENYDDTFSIIKGGIMINNDRFFSCK